MSAGKPWLTSDQLIEAIKRKVSMPVSQNTFSPEDLLEFANEELLLSQVPSVMIYHEEYFVESIDVPLVANQQAYQVPERAIGLKLRDVFYKDTHGNLCEMTRVSPDDKSFFQYDDNLGNGVIKFFLKGNDVVLTNKLTNPVGSLQMDYYLRPGQLVRNDRAAIISAFIENISIVNSSLLAGDTITITDSIFTAVAGSPGALEFQIGASSTISATNLATAINTANIGVSANNGSPSTADIVLIFNNLADSKDVQISNAAGMIIGPLQGIQFQSIPSNITDGALIDFLQTKPGHRTLAMDSTIDTISSDSIQFSPDQVPTNLVVGDYICLANECIIPQIPTDLHYSLVERAAARVMSAIGDTAGLAMIDKKIQENNQSQSTLLDNRVEGSPQKVTARNSLLQYRKMGSRRGL